MIVGHPYLRLIRALLLVISKILTAVLLTLAPCRGEQMVGLPDLPPDVKTSNQVEKIALGRRLFNDTSLSQDGRVSCSSCHQPERLFTDGKAVAHAKGRRTGFRNTPSLLNVSYLTSLFWDGRASSLSEQAAVPLTNSREHGFADERAAVMRLSQLRGYREAFQQLYGDGPDAIRIATIGDAIAAYERTLLSGNSAFDHYQFEGRGNALSEAQVRGLDLFRSRAGCSGCHLIGNSSALFTDLAFHASPLRLTEAVSRQLPTLVDQLRKSQDQGASAVNRLVTENSGAAALGHFVATLRPEDIGHYRTPSLRNVALTRPYMHDGSISTLEAAVEAELYIRDREGQYPISLTVDERNDLVAFLRGLTDDAFTKAR